MKQKIPNFIVHYNRSEPFRTITSISSDEREAVIESLDEGNSWGLNRFSDSNYLKLRFEIEKLMREKFIAMGGTPILSHPIYFFLGRNTSFEAHSLNIGYAIDLADLHKNSVSFSYGDTMLSFNKENRSLSGERYRNPLCNRLFGMDELKELFENDLFPAQSALPVEAHLWLPPTEKIVKIFDR